MDVDPSEPTEGSSPKRPPPPNVDAGPAGGRMRTDPPEEVAALGLGRSALDLEGGELRDRYATQQVKVSRPCDLKAAVNTPMEGWSGYHILFPTGERSPTPSRGHHLRGCLRTGCMCGMAGVRRLRP